MATFTAVAAGNWSDVETWRAVSAWTATTEYAANAFVMPTVKNAFVYEVTAGGGGNSGESEPTWPTTIGNTVGDGDLTWTCRQGKPGSGDTANLGGYVVTADEDITCTLIDCENNTASRLTISGNRTITADIAIGNTTTSAGVYIASGDTIINGTVTCTPTTGSTNNRGVTVGIGASLTINKVGGVALQFTGTAYGSGIYTTAEATTSTNITINGDVVCDTTSFDYRTAAVSVSSVGTTTINGDVTGPACAISCRYTTLVINGELINLPGRGTGVSGTRGGINLSSPMTLTWLGTRTIASDSVVRITRNSSAANIVFANADGKLELQLAGKLCVYDLTGIEQSITDYHATGGQATITLMSVSARLWITNALPDCIIGPTLPTEAEVETGVSFGYNAALTGTYASGGYTYGSEDAAHVLTTAGAGAGTYIPVAAGDVRAGVSVGVSPAVGTLKVGNTLIFKPSWIS